MFNFMGMMGNHEDRLVQNDKVDGGEVDTCLVTDSSRPYETGIKHRAYNGGAWIIVELYVNREEALAGHLRWVEKMRLRPDELTDVSECDIEMLARLLGTTVQGMYPRQEGTP